MTLFVKRPAWKESADYRKQTRMASDGALAWKVLQRGFTYEGEHVPLMGTQGIFTETDGPMLIHGLQAFTVRACTCHGAPPHNRAGSCSNSDTSDFGGLADRSARFTPGLARSAGSSFSADYSMV